MFPYICISSLGFIVLLVEKVKAAFKSANCISQNSVLLQRRSLGVSPDSNWPMTSVVTGAMRLSGCKKEWRRSRRRRAEFDQTEANPQVV